MAIMVRMNWCMRPEISNIIGRRNSGINTKQKKLFAWQCDIGNGPKWIMDRTVRATNSMDRKP